MQYFESPEIPIGGHTLFSFQDRSGCTCTSFSVPDSAPSVEGSHARLHRLYPECASSGRKCPTRNTSK